MTANPMAINSISNPLSQYGSELSPTSINNPYSQYGSELSNQSPNNPYASTPSVEPPPSLYEQ
jgi:hypothetical protein